VVFLIRESTIACLCDDGKMPAYMDWLHKWQIIRANRWGSRFMSHVGIGSRVEDLVGQLESMCLISDSVTGANEFTEGTERY